MVFLHFILLHKVGSNTPLGIFPDIKFLNFYPYFYIKDVFSFLNDILIDLYGINGAAISTLIVISLFTILKVLFIKSLL